MNEGGDSDRKRSRDDCCVFLMDIESLNHQRENAETRNKGIIGGLHCEWEEGGTETGEKKE